MIAGTLWTNLALQVITFAASVLTARILGPIGRGELALVLLYPQLVAHVAMLGFDRAIAVVGGRGELRSPIRAIIHVVALLSLPAMALSYVVVHWRIDDPRLASLAIVYVAYVPAGYFFALAAFFLNGIGDFPRFNRIRLGFYSVNLAFLLGIWLSNTAGPLNWVVIANVAAAYAALSWAAWQLIGVHAEPVAKHDAATDLSIISKLAARFLIPVTLVHLSAYAYQIVLEQRAGIELLGLFVVYFSYSRLLSPVGSAISAHLFRLGIVGTGDSLATIFRKSLIAYSLLSVTLWLISPVVIPTVFGSAFQVDFRAVGLLMVSGVFAMLANSLGEFMNGRRKISADAKGLALYLIVIALLGWNLLPPFGLAGIASAVLAADAVRCTYLVTRASIETGQPVESFWRLQRTDASDLVTAVRNSRAQWRT